MSESIWEKNLSIPERGQLEETIKTDVCIIGAGMAGILTGYLLQKQGLGVVILEADRIGSGQTRGTTAKITSQHGLIYSRYAEILVRPERGSMPVPMRRLLIPMNE